MDQTINCPFCNQLLLVDEEDRVDGVVCPKCDGDIGPRLIGDQLGPVMAATSAPAPALAVAPPPTAEAVPPTAIEPPPVSPPPMAPETPLPGFDPGPQHTCPVCWLKFGVGEIMHIAVHDSLRGDPLLGEDAPQRFHATRFGYNGQAMDAMGLPCPNMACPHCRRKLPHGFLESRYLILSLVGDQSAGKSYYLTVLSKVLPNTIYRNFNIVCQDADPTGNAPLNEMKRVLFSASSPAQAKLAKTQLEGAMYERLPRQGRIVALPKPFIYSIMPNGSEASGCSVVFYDNAGEHFQPGIDIVEQPGAQHVSVADGIMFLFDPFNSPEFRRALGDTVDPQMEKPALDQQDTILAEMRNRIFSLKHVAAGQKVDTPLAVILGKCDAWYHLINPEGPPNPLANGSLNLNVLYQTSARLRDFLLEVAPSIVANAETLSDTVVFFPVSSFGHTPVKIGEGDYVPDPEQLRPVLAEVPPLWLLSCANPELFPSTTET
jgi:hypothetical protein